MKTLIAGVCLLIPFALLPGADSTGAATERFAAAGGGRYLRDIGSLGAPQRKAAVAKDLAAVPVLIGGALEIEASAARKSPATTSIEPHDGVIDLGSASSTAQLTTAEDMGSRASAPDLRSATSSDPRAIMNTAAEMLGRQLGVSSLVYRVYDADGDTSERAAS